MKNTWMRVAALALVCALLCGCHTMVEDDGERLVYASFYPVYALAQPIFQDVPGMSLKCLVQPQDGCLRSYQLSDWDSVALSAADALLMAGRGLESFSLSEGSLAVVTLMEHMDLYTWEASDADEDDHFTGENPWLYLSVEGAKQLAQAIAASMMSIDSAYGEIYAHNLADFETQLDALLEDMEQTLLDAPAQSVVLMHEGLIYLAEELGLHVAGTVHREPGSDLYGNDLSEALSTLEASGARVVLIERQAPGHLRQTLEQAGYRVALIDTLSTHSASYADAQTSNARSIREALIGAEQTR